MSQFIIGSHFFYILDRSVYKCGRFFPTENVDSEIVKSGSASFSRQRKCWECENSALKSGFSNCSMARTTTYEFSITNPLLHAKKSKKQDPKIMPCTNFGFMDHFNLFAGKTLVLFFSTPRLGSSGRATSKKFEEKSSRLESLLTGCYLFSVASG